MKILVVVSHDYGAKNGVAIVSKYLVDGLRNIGHDVLVVTNKTNENTSDQVIDGIRVKRFDIRYDRLKRAKGDIKSYRHYMQTVDCDVLIMECLQNPMVDCIFDCLERIGKIRILHTHDFSGLYLLPLQWRDDIYHTVGNTLNFFLWKRYYEKTVPPIINKFTGILSLSKVNRDVDYVKGIYKGLHDILPNAADDMFFYDGYNNGINNIISTNKYFISVANYAEIKNQCAILKQYYKAKASRDYAMVFVGSITNHYYYKLVKLNEKLKKRYGRRETLFLYGIDRTYVPNLISGAAIYLCASKWEAFSISLIEAMAVGTPFVGLDVGNARELPGGITVDLIDDIHLALDNLIADEDERIRLSEAGRKYSRENNRQEKAVERLDFFINKCMSM